MTRRVKLPLPHPPVGRPAAGRLVRILYGQDQGYIRVRDGRTVFFDRRDVVGAGFNDLAVGDAVGFELIEDRLSGPRGVRVRRHIRARRI